MDSIILYSVAGAFLLLSLLKDRGRTKSALKKAWKSFEGILPQFLMVLLLVGLLLTIFDTETISKIIGPESGWPGVALAALVGAVTLIPGFIAFATSAALLKSGAGYMQIAAFISSLMMVGFVTLPVEMKYFGKKVSILRNLFSFFFAFIVAAIIGWVV